MGVTLWVIPGRDELPQASSWAFLGLVMLGKAMANEVLLMMMRQTTRTQGDRERNECFSVSLGKEVTSK